MRSYYDDGSVTIYHGDCREMLPRLPRESVDLIVTDPPYGVSWQSGRRALQLDELQGDGADAAFEVPDALGLALPLLRNRRHVYIFGSFDLTGLKLTSPIELVWDKGSIGPGDLVLPWGPAHEAITFAVYDSSPAHRAAGDGRLAARLRRGSVLRVPRLTNRGAAEHPTEKPVDLLRQLIESSSILGETVLDPFMGSGSTLEAAKLEGRRAVGIEIEERYCEIAAKRLAQGVLDLA